MACIVRSVGDLEGIKHSLLRGFFTRASINQLRSREQRAALLAYSYPSVQGGLELLISKKHNPLADRRR